MYSYKEYKYLKMENDLKMKLTIFKSNVRYSYNLYLNGKKVKNFGEIFNKNLFQVLKGIFNNKVDILRIDIYYNKHFKIGSIVLEF